MPLASRKGWRFLEENLHWFVVGSVLLCFLKVYFQNPQELRPAFLFGGFVVGGIIYAVLKALFSFMLRGWE